MPSMQYRNPNTYRNPYNYRGGQAGALVQDAPLSDTVDLDDTDTYTSQLRASINGIPDYPTYVTTSTTIAVDPAVGARGTTPVGLVVDPNGAISTSGSLTPGVYTASGTMSDALLNTGTWAYTLTVVSVITPQTSIIPVSAAAPSGIEIAIPFRFDLCTGGVATLTSYAQIYAQHIKTIILTAYSERVMLPTYGSPVEGALFSPIVQASFGIIQSDIQQAIRNWEPAVDVYGVYVQSTPENPSTLDITVQYAVAPLNDVNTVTCSVGGGIQQVVSA